MVAVLLDLLGCELLNLFLEARVLVEELMDRIHYIGRVIEEHFQVIERILRDVIEFIGFGCCYRLYTAYAGCDTRLHDDTDRTDTAGRRDMASTAEFNRVTEFDHTHIVTVFLAE